MILPAPDPLPLPGPVWLLKFLLGLGWFLHALPMYGLLGGGLVALYAEAAGVWSEFHRLLARRLWAIMPGVMGIAITFGIVPLLFVQVLYGQAFFTTAVLAAWPWLSVIPSLLLAYYGVYVNAFWGDRLGGWRFWIGLGSYLLIGWVGYQFTNQVRLIEQPALWPGLARNPAAEGLFLARDPASLIRFLHFFGGAVAFAGALAVLLAGYLRRWREADVDFTARTARLGGRWALLGLGVQVAAGAAFLRAAAGGLTLPPAWTPVLLAWAGLAALAALLLIVGQARPDPLVPGLLALVALVPAVALSALQRLWLREAALAGFLEVETLTVAFQTGPFLVFAVGLLLAIGIMSWVIAAALAPRAPGAPTARDLPAPRREVPAPAWNLGRLLRPRRRV